MGAFNFIGGKWQNEVTLRYRAVRFDQWLVTINIRFAAENLGGSH